MFKTKTRIVNGFHIYITKKRTHLEYMKQTAHSKLCNMNDSDRRDEISENDTTYICAHI